MSKPVSPGIVAASLEEYWSPRRSAELDDSYVKGREGPGSFVWRRPRPGRLNCSTFLKGRLRIEFENASVDLG